MNEARKEMFWKNFKQNNKIIDISLLPPCPTSLQNKSLRANYVSNMWRHAKYPILGLGPITHHGWLEYGKPDWINIAYPEDVASYYLLLMIFQMMVVAMMTKSTLTAWMHLDNILAEDET